MCNDEQLIARLVLRTDAVVKSAYAVDHLQHVLSAGSGEVDIAAGHARCEPFGVAGLGFFERQALPLAV